MHGRRLPQWFILIAILSWFAWIWFLKLQYNTIQCLVITMTVCHLIQLNYKVWKTLINNNNNNNQASLMIVFSSRSTHWLSWHLNNHNGHLTHLLEHILSNWNQNNTLIPTRASDLILSMILNKQPTEKQDSNLKLPLQRVNTAPSILH